MDTRTIDVAAVGTAADVAIRGDFLHGEPPSRSHVAHDREA